jgi:hypothetical protein
MALSQSALLEVHDALMPLTPPTSSVRHCR